MTPRTSRRTPAAPLGESAGPLDWHDPATGSAAAYRVRAAAGGAAEVRTWTLAEGSVTARTWTSRLDSDPDLGTLRAGGLRLRTLEALRSYAVTTDPDVGLSATRSTSLTPGPPMPSGSP